MRKLFTFIFSLSLILSFSLLSLSIVKGAQVSINSTYSNDVSYDLSSNYFAQEANKETIEYPTTEELNKYKLVGENEYLSLYLIEKTLNIAVYIKSTGYIFYTNTKYYQYDIEAYYVTGGLSAISSTIPVNGTYSVSIDQKKWSPTKTFDYESVEDGFKCHFDYVNLGISFNLYVYLDDDRLVVNVPNEEISEVDYKETTAELQKNDDGTYSRVEVTSTYNYLLKSLTFFEYFGSSYQMSDEKWLNGYTFIPDGSGALLRYSNSSSYKTAYVKTVYGTNYGIDNVTSSYTHLKDESILTLPVFGVNHGYNQNAFLCVIEEGDSNAELHSNPYGYLNQLVETTYYRFNYRNSYNIELSTGKISSLNSDRYTGNLLYSYNFLTGEDASYSGMATLYKDRYLNILDNDITSGDIEINLNVLAQDYKKGLFGKNFQEMTTYSDLLEIVKELESLGVSDFNINYIGYSRGGYYNNSNYKPRVSFNLGSRKELLELISYINESSYSISAYLDPTTSYNESTEGTVKKLNLSTYERGTKSSLFDNNYQLLYDDFSDKIIKYNRQYASFGISDITLVNIGNLLTSYRYKNVNYYRETNKETIKNELQKLVDNGYSIGLMGANSYTYSYLSKYYDMYTESSNYTFITDSVPFISLLLSGQVELYSTDINYADDYDKNALRLIEYNIYPSFVITKEDSSKLRYTNCEYLYCSEYERWKEIITSYYSTVNNALKYVKGKEMISHEVLSKGVSLITYEDGIKIIVNYSDNDFNFGSIIIESKGYEVIS